ncbi:hypothetical protein OF83DRAFT_155626 [Amylostereum chailletii]|nr:hypothetical protein OF83DRAFT_155626 [Amylostereum chailletii]
MPAASSPSNSPSTTTIRGPARSPPSSLIFDGEGRTVGIPHSGMPKGGSSHVTYATPAWWATDQLKLKYPHADFDRVAFETCEHHLLSRLPASFPSMPRLLPLRSVVDWWGLGADRCFDRRVTGGYRGSLVSSASSFRTHS